MHVHVCMFAMYMYRCTYMYNPSLLIFPSRLTIGSQERESVSSERDQLKGLVEELGKELHQSKAQLGEQKTAAEYLNTQLEVRILCLPYT